MIDYFADFGGVFYGGACADGEADYLTGKKLGYREWGVVKTGITWLHMRWGSIVYIGPDSGLGQQLSHAVAFATAHPYHILVPHVVGYGFRHEWSHNIGVRDGA